MFENLDELSDEDVLELVDEVGDALDAAWRVPSGNNSASGSPGGQFPPPHSLRMGWASIDFAHRGARHICSGTGVKQRMKTASSAAASFWRKPPSET